MIMMSVVTPVVALTAAVTSSLDTWVVMRYRGAQLLPDSMTTASADSLASGTALARVESMRDGIKSDTLFAVQFVADGVDALTVDGAVRLAGPTGTVMPLTGRVIARRRFRAPGTLTAWRSGWAYLVLVPSNIARANRGRSATNTSPTALQSSLNGWLLLGTTSPPVPRGGKAR